MLLSLPRLRALGAARVGTDATWPLHLLLGWVLAGLASLTLTVALSDAAAPRRSEWLSHAVDLGRHVGIGLASALIVWAFRRLAPRAAWLGWLAFLATSIALGARVLPTDLEGLAERSADNWALSPALASALIVTGVGSSIPALAWITRRRPGATTPLERIVSVLRALAALGVALAALWLNVTTSPGSNPSAHLYLTWATAIALAHALPRLELAAGWTRARAAGGLALALAAWGLWALAGPHSNTVMIQIARRPSSLHLVALFHTDGGLDTVQAALTARAGPFFTDRTELAPTAPSAGARPGRPPIVIFFSIDSLRADVSTHPKHRRSMPNLVALMERGVTFSNARAPGSMTKYTLASISSGRYFSQQHWAARGQSHWPSDDRSVHLAEVLTQAGAFTAAFPATTWLTNASGVLRGFSRNTWAGDTLPGRQQHWVEGASLTRQLIETLEHEAARPGFYWVHYLDSHEPFSVAGKGGKKFARYLRALGVVDGYLGELRQAITRLGLDERVLLFVMSDHGEAFGEHDSAFHGGSLYDELVRVPLVVAGPGVVKRTVDAPVSLVDLGATVLDWFELPTPSSFMGESLVPFLLGQSREFSRPIVAETRLKQSMLFRDGRKVIRDLRRQTLEVYDLSTDPGELDNLSDDIDPDQEEHVLLMRGFFQVHTYREDGYRVPYVK